MTCSKRTFMALAWHLRAILLVPLALATPLADAQPGAQQTPFSAFVPPDINAPPKGDWPVTFSSPQGDAPGVTIPGAYFKPVGTPRGAVVIVNAAVGWTDAREGNYGRALSSAGYGVLVIDTYGPRAIVNTQGDNAKLSAYAQARDAFAARRYLISLGLPADRMAVMGTGRGGTIALLAADRTFVPDETDRFSLAIAISAGCMFHPRAPKPGASVFMAIADKDNVAGVSPCRDLAKEYAAAGGSVAVKTYPGASNSFEGHPVMVRMVRDHFMETFVDCKVPVEADGRASLNARLFAESDYAALISEMRRVCMKRGGITWTNLTQKANVTLDVIDFLDANFRRQ